MPASRCRQVRSGLEPRCTGTTPSICTLSIRRAFEKDAMTRYAMTVTGSAKISVACSIVETPPATSMATVRTAVTSAQKIRSHFGPSCAGSGMDAENVLITIAPELALVR